MPHSTVCKRGLPCHCFPEAESGSTAVQCSQQYVALQADIIWQACKAVLEQVILDVSNCFALLHFAQQACLPSLEASARRLALSAFSTALVADPAGFAALPAALLQKLLEDVRLEVTLLPCACPIHLCHVVLFFMPGAQYVRCHWQVSLQEWQAMHGSKPSSMYAACRRLLRDAPIAFL